MLAAQKESLRRALVQFKQSIKGSGFRMRSLEAVLPYASINYIVKNARKICTERDVELLGVTKEFSLRIFKIIELHIPSTTSSLLSTEVTSNSRPVRQCSARHILNDISNLSSLL